MALNSDFLSKIKAWAGFDFTPNLDGTFHTEKNVRKLWYIGSQELVSGQDVSVITLGDFVTGERVRIEHPEAMSKKNPLYRGQQLLIDTINAQIEVARNRNREEVKREFFSASETGHSEYQRKKLWPTDLGLQGCRVQNNHTLLVPLTDESGELQGIQYIYASGDKQFNLGAKKEGSFFTFGKLEPGKVCFVTEGIATGMSVYLATKETTFVAFDAGNLLAVARYIRRKCPSARIIIAGDDDPKKDPTKQSYNTGILAAKRAADQCGGIFTVPKFNRELIDEKDLSDWNDLHVLKGIDEVRDQLLSVKKDKIAFIDALGFRGGDYYYTSNENPQLTVLSEHSETEFLKLQPIEYFRTNFGQVNRQGQVIINWSEVKSSHMAACRERGFFSHRKVRGLGVWRHDGLTVVHLGDRLLVGNKEQPLSYFGKECIYEYSERIDLLSSRASTTSDTEFLSGILDTINTETPIQVKLLLGWVMSAQLCGSLRWRSHCYISGQAGSGKSSTIENLIKPLLSGYKLTLTKGASTEAGIRQAIKSDAVPVIFDEFESDTEKSARRLESVMELFRQSSSEGSGNILKGSSGGEAIEYNARFSGLVSAISPKITREADMSRFTAIELIKSSQDPEKYKRLQGIFERITDQFATEFFLRNVELLPKYIENIKRFEDVLKRTKSPRYSEQHAPLLAGFHMIFSDSLISETDALLLVKELDYVSKTYGDTVEIEANTPDQNLCLRHLLDSRVKVSMNGKLEDWTINALLYSVIKDGEDPKKDWASHPKKQLLSQVGIYPQLKKDKVGIFILNQHPELTKIFYNTPYSGQWNTYLKRVDGAFITTIYDSGDTRKGVFTPLPLGASSQAPILESPEDLPF